MMLNEYIYVHDAVLQYFEFRSLPIDRVHVEVEDKGRWKSRGWGSEDRRFPACANGFFSDFFFSVYSCAYANLIGTGVRVWYILFFSFIVSKK